MKRLVADVGGRPPANDDFMALQHLVLNGSGGPLLAGFGTCVVSGCAVTPAGAGTYNVAPGVVWMGSGLFDFPGASGVAMPGSFVLGPVEVIDQRVYQTGGTKPAITDQRVLLDVHDGDGVPVIDADGPIMWYERVAAKTRALGDVQFGFYDLSGYDATGKGRGANRGWALINGQNGTNADALGRVPVFQNPNRTDYDTAGKIGGSESVALTVQQMPPHKHTIENGGQHSHAYATGTDRTSGGNNTDHPRWAGIQDAQTGLGGEHSHGMLETGGGQGHENRQPFIVLSARQWIGL